MSEVRSSFWQDALIGFGGAGLLYLPWVPTLLHQVQHTGAPWLNPPNFGAPVQISKSLLGGGTPTVALVLAGGSGIAAILARRVEDKERTALLAGATIVLGTLAVAWIVSQVSPAWTTRYLGVLLGPMLLLGALGLARAGNLGAGRRSRSSSAIWAIPKSYGLENKSNAVRPAQATSVPRAAHRATSCSRCSRSRGRCSRTTWSTSAGRPSCASATRWARSRTTRSWTGPTPYDKLKDATPSKNLEPLIASLPPGGRVLIVHPVTSRADDWDAPWTELVRRRAAQWGAALANDTRLERVKVVPLQLSPRHAHRSARRDLREDRMNENDAEATAPSQPRPARTWPRSRP